jgi:hypothetical protein
LQRRFVTSLVVKLAEISDPLILRDVQTPSIEGLEPAKFRGRRGHTDALAPVNHNQAPVGETEFPSRRSPEEDPQLVVNVTLDAVKQAR